MFSNLNPLHILIILIFDLHYSKKIDVTVQQETEILAEFHVITYLSILMIAELGPFIRRH